MSETKTSSDQDLISQLGNFQKDFRVVKYKLKRDLRIGFGLLLIILALLSALVGFFTSWQAIRLHGRAVILYTLPLPALIFLVSLPLGILLLHYTRHHWQDKISLHKNGLLLQKGKKTFPWLWESTKCFNAETTAIKFGISVVAEKYKLTFEDSEGQTLIVPGRYTDMNVLVEQVRNTLLPQMYERTTALLRDGNTMSFSTGLKVVFKGVIINDDLCRWISLNPPKITKGAFHLHRAGDEKLIYKCPIKNIKNLDLLLTLFKNPPAN